MINFQFSIFKLSKKQLLKLCLVSLAAITFGAIISLVLNYQALKDYRQSQVKAPANTAEPVEEEMPKIATYSGTIKPLGPSIYMEGTHFLEDGKGKMITLLKSRKIDLAFLEGQTVEIEGELSEAVEGGQTILEVEKVRF